MGHPELPRVLEPGIAVALAPVVGEPGGATDEPGPRLRLRLLGGFGVLADGRPVDMPDGKPAQLVKLLAVLGRPVPVDEAVELLWPEAEPDVGRRRMRNVLARIRAACGELMTRGEDSLRLEGGVEVDVALFEADARAALAARGPDAEALARRALARYQGELLPGDRYEEFTVAARERVALRHLALLDRLARLAADRGDADEALRHLEDAIAAEPLDEHRYDAAIAIALRHGRRAHAVRLVRRALAVADELATDPSAPIIVHARRLGVALGAGRR